MTLDEIISNAEFCANEYKKFSEIAPERSLTFKKCEEDHRQLAEWLKDYKRLKEQEPKMKTGKWIIMDIEDCELFMAKCSECGVIVDSRMISKYPYCHYCGAKMVEPQESED